MRLIIDRFLVSNSLPIFVNLGVWVRVCLGRVAAVKTVNYFIPRVFEYPESEIVCGTPFNLNRHALV